MINEEPIEIMLEEEIDFLKSETSSPSIKHPYVQREDSIWKETAEKWRAVQEDLKKLEMEEKRLREELIELAGDKSSEGGGIKVTLSERRGTIDYKAIPLLQGMDLEPYRKSSSKIWSIKSLPPTV